MTRCSIFGASLSELHCAHACVCLLACWLVYLLGPTTYHKFQTSALKYFRKIECPRCTCTSARPYCVKGYSQTVARKRPGAKMTQAGCVGSTHSNLFTDKSVYAMSLTVVLSPCSCNLSSSSSLMNSCIVSMCGHLHVYIKLLDHLIAQARPRMMQHLTSCQCVSQMT